MSSDDPEHAVTVPLHGAASPVAATETPAPPALASTMPGHAPAAGELERLGRFEIKSKLGEGGMGVVLLAIDPQLGRRVALKVLRRELDSSDARRRLLREAQGVAQLTHENVITVHEVGTHDGHDYVAMEYVAGGTLTSWQRGRSWREIVEIYVRAGRGLAAAHDAGLVHRDFKPDNVLVGDDGRVRVSDFGLVAAVGDQTQTLTATERSLRDESELAVSLTRTGSIMGTPRYMAAEQHLGQSVDARADQFAFCAALYEALYGQPPFVAEVYSVLVAMVLEGEIAPVPADSPVPLEIRDAVLRGLSRKRDDRFGSMRELLARLERSIAPVVPWAPRRGWVGYAIGGAIAIGASIAIVAVLAGRGSGEPVSVDAPQRTATDWKKQGNLELAAGNFAAAAAAFEQTRALDPALHVDAVLADAYLEASDCPAARAAFDRDIAYQGTLPDNQKTWGRLRPQLEAMAAQKLAGCHSRGKVIVTDTSIEVKDLRIAFDDDDKITAATVSAVDLVAESLRANVTYRLVEVRVSVATGASQSRKVRADRRTRVLVDALVARGVERVRLRATPMVDESGKDDVNFNPVSRLDLRFGPDDSSLPATQVDLDWLADLVRKDPANRRLKITVDLVVTATNADHVQAKAEHRANAIRDYLLAARIPPARVIAEGRTSPMSATDTVYIFRSAKAK